MTGSGIFPPIGRTTVAALAWSLATALLTGSAGAQPAPQQPRDYFVGHEGIGLPVAPPPPNAGDTGAPFAPASAGVRMFGALYSTESCSYDAKRGVIVAPSRGVPQAVRANDAWVSFINHDGSVHTPRWIGIQNAGNDRDTMNPPLVLNEPYGSVIRDGLLYLADRDGGTRDGDTLAPSVAVVRVFDMASGRPVRSITVAGSTGLNDIAVAADGTIFGTNTGSPDSATWAVWKIAPDGAVSLFKRGAPLNLPNGIEIDGDGNVVVVNMGNADVLTFGPSGDLVRTEQAALPGSDGLVIMPDGVKFVSSVSKGGISMIPPGGKARLIAQNIPSAASMCYDAGANQLVIPMNANNGLAFLSLRGIWSPAQPPKRR